MPSYTDPLSGITVNWIGGGAFAPGLDGRLLIERENNAPVIVQSYTPAYDSVNLHNGAVYQIPGDANWTDYALDGRMSLAGLLDTVPITVELNRTLLISKSRYPADQDPYSNWVSTPPGNPPCAPYHQTGCKSEVEYMLLVQVVAYDPTDPLGTGQPAADLLMCPPAIGNAPINDTLRGVALPQAAARIDDLPAIVDLDGVATALNIPVTDFDVLLADLERIFAAFSGEICTGWRMRKIGPGFQNPAYGSHFASCVSQGLTLLMSSRYTAAQKRPLALLMAQWGLDIACSLFDGREMEPNGGHAQGRKALIMFAGFLFNIDIFKRPDQLYAGTPPFQENIRWITIPWEDQSDPGWNWGWEFKVDAFQTNAQRGVLMIPKSPSTWGDPADPAHSTYAWYFSYFGDTTGAEVGTALFMDAVGLGRAWSAPGLAAINTFMRSTVATEANAVALNSAGILVNWGQDYGYDPYIPQMCAEAYRAHYPDSADTADPAVVTHPSPGINDEDN